MCVCVRVRAVSNIVFKGSCRTELLNLLDTFGDGNDLLMFFSHCLATRLYAYVGRFRFLFLSSMCGCCLDR